MARLNFHGITSYDLINLLEHIIQNAQHLTPHLCTAAAGGARVWHGGKHNISCDRRRDLDGTACCQSLSFFTVLTMVRPNYSSMGDTVLLTLAPTVNLGEHWDQAPVQVKTDRATFSAVTASHVSLLLGDDKLEDSDSLRGWPGSC